MRALVTACIAAIEAAAIALAGLVVVAVPTLLVWWLAFGLGAEPTTIASTVAGVWLLGHAVPLVWEIPADVALGFGLAPEAISVPLSVVPLGFAFVTVLLAFRAGWRFALRDIAGIAGVIGGVLGFAGAAVGIVLAGDPPLGIEPWAAIVLPALWFTGAAVLGFLTHSARMRVPWWEALTQRIETSSRLGTTVSEGARDVLRIALGAFAALAALSALAFTIALVAGYVEIVTLSQALQLDALGVALLFLVHLFVLPNACLWSLAWLTGGGFSVGSGTSVTPFETLLGPIPVLPLFGAIPPAWGWAAILAPLLIVLAGVLVGGLLGPRSRERSWARSLLVPVISAAFVGAVVTGLTALSGGAIGPGRLAESGPVPWLTGALVFGELAAGMLLGTTARRLDAGRFADRLARLRSTSRREDEVRGESAELADLGSQETIPLEGLLATQSPHVDSGTTQETETVRVPPRLRSEAAESADLQATVPIDPLDRHDPHDQPDAEALLGLSGSPAGRGLKDPHEPGRPAASDSADRPGDVDDPDEIARAFAWDHASALEPPPEEPRRRRWKFGRHSQ